MKGTLARVIYWGLLTLALLGLAWQLYPLLRDFVDTESQAITYPYSIDYGEGPLLDQTLRLARFQGIYSNSFDKPPYTISNYPPLYLLIQVPLAWIFGPAYWYGRLINLICVLLTALFIALTLHSLTHNWVGPIVAGLLLIASPYVQHWAKFNRIDELALALSWAGVFVIVRYVGQAAPLLTEPNASAELKLAELVKKGLSYRPFWLGSLLLVGAIFTRQTYALAAPVAVFFWLVAGARGTWKRRLIQAVLLGVAVGALTLVLFLALNIATQGGFFLNIVIANVNAFDWGTVRRYSEEILHYLWPLLGLAVAFLLVGWKRSAWALVFTYVLAATAGSVTIGKDGSNVNYLLEFSAALSLAAGAALGWALQLKQWYTRLVVQVLVIGLLAYQCNMLVDWNRNLSVSYLKDQMLYRSNTERIVQMIHDSPGIVLADEYMGLVPLAGKGLYFQPFEFKQMSDAGIWDQTPFLQQIADHKFDIILWYRSPAWQSVEGRWTVAQRNAITEYYLEDQQIGDVHVMVPKK